MDNLQGWDFNLAPPSIDVITEFNNGDIYAVLRYATSSGMLNKFL